MAAIVNPYDNLYTNLKNKFTVVNGGAEYTLGDFMLMKAGKSNNNNSAVVAVKANEPHAVVSVLNFVNDKLTAKAPAKKEKTIKRFPLRTSFSAALSAVAAAALVLSCGIFSLIGRTHTTAYTAENSVVEEQVEPTEKTIDYTLK